MLEGVETTVRLNLPGHDIPALSGIVEGSRTKWRFQPHALEISYGWYSVVGYWRVITFIEVWVDYKVSRESDRFGFRTWRFGGDWDALIRELDRWKARQS